MLMGSFLQVVILSDSLPRSQPVFLSWCEVLFSPAADPGLPRSFKPGPLGTHSGCDVDTLPPSALGFVEVT